MDPLYAKAQGKAGNSSTRAKSSKKKKRSTSSRTSQSAGQPSGRPQLGSGEPTAVSRSNSKRSKKQSSRAPSESSKAASVTMHAMNVIDVVVGISLIVEATVIPEEGGMAAAIALGVVLLLSSVCATVGYFSKSMNRGGLVLSMVLSSLACLTYIGVFVWALVDWDSLSTFFDVEKEFLEGKNVTIAIAAITLAVFDGIK